MGAYASSEESESHILYLESKNQLFMDCTNWEILRLFLDKCVHNKYTYRFVLYIEVRYTY